MLGKVEVSPTINAVATAGGYACKICGSPATGECSKCGFHICGRCLRKVYSITGHDANTTHYILHNNPSFLCRECFESERTIYYWEKRYSELRYINGYLTKDELEVRICEKCNLFFAPFICIHCKKMFCANFLDVKEEVFSWNTINKSNSYAICDFIIDNYNCSVYSSSISDFKKSDNYIYILFYNKKSFSLKLNNEKTEVSLTIGDVGMIKPKLFVRTETDGDLYICKDFSSDSYRSVFSCPKCYNV